MGVDPTFLSCLSWPPVVFSFPPSNWFSHTFISLADTFPPFLCCLSHFPSLFALLSLSFSDYHHCCLLLLGSPSTSTSISLTFPRCLLLHSMLWLWLLITCSTPVLFFFFYQMAPKFQHSDPYPSSKDPPFQTNWVKRANFAGSWTSSPQST